MRAKNLQLLQDAIAAAEDGRPCPPAVWEWLGAGLRHHAETGERLDRALGLEIDAGQDWLQPWKVLRRAAMERLFHQAAAALQVSDGAKPGILSDALQDASALEQLPMGARVPLTLLLERHDGQEVPLPKSRSRIRNILRGETVAGRCGLAA